MLPYHVQERPESCVPACVRMVLAGAGIEVTEDVLYHCCETDIDGTLPSKAVECVQSFGLAASSRRLASLDELREQIAMPHLYPIVFVNLSPIRGINTIHAIIVEGIEDENGAIAVIDPAYPPNGRRQWALALFEIGWRFARNQTILISTAAVDSST